ncbi:hypothetical protein D3C83_192690 [compost metagenome]
MLYHRPLNYVASPYASAPTPQPSGSNASGGTQVNIMQFNLPEMPGGASVGFYYLWQPNVP